MKRTVSAIVAAALALAGAPAIATAASPFGSSSSLSSTSAFQTPEQRIRTAIEASLIHDGYTVDPELSRIAQQSLAAPTQAERDAALGQLHEAGLVSDSGGSLHSDVEAIEAYFAPIGEPRPATGKKAAVAVSYGPITTPYMVYFFD